MRPPDVSRRPKALDAPIAAFGPTAGNKVDPQDTMAGAPASATGRST